jgi:hypothetical protein
MMIMEKIPIAARQQIPTMIANVLKGYSRIFSVRFASKRISISSSDHIGL